MVKQKRRLNVKNLLIVILCGLLVIGLSFGVIRFILNKLTALPEELKSDIPNSSYVSSIGDDLSIAVYYPVFENKDLNKIMKDNASIIMDEVLNIPFESEEPIYLKVEYLTTEYNNKYVGIEYKFDYQGNNERFNYFYTLDGQTIDNDIFDDFLKLQISLDTRGHAKEDKDINEFAFSAEFRQLTDVKNLNNYRYAFSEDRLVIMYDDLIQGLPLTFDMKLNEISNHINLDLGVKQTIRDDLRTPYRYVDKNRPMVALTYDDGPYGECAQQLIDAFYKYDGAGTLYILGSRIKGEEETIRSYISHGHEIGNHSYSHKDLNRLSGDDLLFELNETPSMVNELTEGFYNIKTTRAPYGNSNKTVRENAQTPIIFWSVDTEDWKYRDADTIYQNIMNNTGDGDVVLMHEIYQTSVDGSIKAMDKFTEMGYQLVTVSELFEAKGVTLNKGEIYRRP